jgi:hypothetical protein
MGWSNWGAGAKQAGWNPPPESKYTKRVRIMGVLDDARRTWQIGKPIEAWIRLDDKAERGIYATAIVDWMEKEDRHGQGRR